MPKVLILYPHLSAELRPEDSKQCIASQNSKEKIKWSTQ